MIERAHELRRRSHRRAKVRKLLQRLQKATSLDEKQKIFQKLVKRAPWRAAEFQKLLT